MSNNPIKDFFSSDPFLWKGYQDAMEMAQQSSGLPPSFFEPDSDKSVPFQMGEFDFQSPNRDVVNAAKKVAKQSQSFFQQAPLLEPYDIQQDPEMMKLFEFSSFLTEEVAPLANEFQNSLHVDIDRVAQKAEEARLKFLEREKQQQYPVSPEQRSFPTLSPEKQEETESTHEFGPRPASEESPRSENSNPTSPPLSDKKEGSPSQHTSNSSSSGEEGPSFPDQQEKKSLFGMVSDCISTITKHVDHHIEETCQFLWERIETLQQHHDHPDTTAYAKTVLQQQIDDCHDQIALFQLGNAIGRVKQKLSCHLEQTELSLEQQVERQRAVVQHSNPFFLNIALDHLESLEDAQAMAKIGKGIVGMLPSSTGEAIVDSVIHLGLSVGFKAVAKGTTVICKQTGKVVKITRQELNACFASIRQTYPQLVKKAEEQGANFAQNIKSMRKRMVPQSAYAGMGHLESTAHELAAREKKTLWETIKNEPKIYAPNRALPRNKHGNNLPDSHNPHTQLGKKKGKKKEYVQAREFGCDGRHIKDIDFTDHGRPEKHTNPHQHRIIPNQTGGSSKRGGPEPLNMEVKNEK